MAQAPTNLMIFLTSILENPLQKNQSSFNRLSPVNYQPCLITQAAQHDGVAGVLKRFFQIALLQPAFSHEEIQQWVVRKALGQFFPMRHSRINIARMLVIKVPAVGSGPNVVRLAHE